MNGLKLTQHILIPILLLETMPQKRITRTTWVTNPTGKKCWPLKGFGNARQGVKKSNKPKQI